MNMGTEYSIKHLAIIGVGLIGGSFARAMQSAGLVQRISAFGRNEANLKSAVQLGVIDDYSLDIKEVVKDADVIFIATPVGSIENILREIKDHIKANTIITDAGSTKLNVIQAAERVFDQSYENFVAGHPIAGTENSGVEASFATLYQDHRVILTPENYTNPQAVEFVSSLWQAAGAHVVLMTAEHHDQVLAATSHLPHLLAFALVNTLTTLDEKQEIFENAAGGFRDFTRIASSDPAMWQDICLANKDALLEHLEHFMADLKQIKNALECSDGEFLKQTFARAKQSRDDFVDRS